jgi:hypothetical protein
MAAAAQAKKNHCTFLQVIKTQVQLKQQHIKNLLQQAQQKHELGFLRLASWGSVPIVVLYFGFFTSAQKKLYNFQKC